MTLSSRRKPPTTPRSTPSRSEAACAILVACLLGTAAGAAEWRTFLRMPEALLCAMTPVLVEADEAGEAAAGEDQPAGSEGDAAWAEGLTLAQAEPSTSEPGAGSVADATDESAADEPARKEPCVEEQADCRDALQRLRDDKLRGIELDIRVSGRPGNDYPCECRLEGETFEPRRFATTTFTWKAAGYCHKPLYFEDWQLERYGHSHGPLADPFVSAAHFFVTLPVLPYKMGVELPWECVYPLGYYRPGSCAPWTVPAVPISLRGMAVEAATITGIVFVLP